MNFYELRDKALEAVTPENAAVVYAVLALTEQVQGLRRDLDPEDADGY